MTVLADKAMYRRIRDTERARLNAIHAAGDDMAKQIASRVVAALAIGLAIVGVLEMIRQSSL